MQDAMINYKPRSTVVRHCLFQKLCEFRLSKGAWQFSKHFPSSPETLQEFSEPPHCTLQAQQNSQQTRHQWILPNTGRYSNSPNERQKLWAHIGRRVSIFPHTSRDVIFVGPNSREKTRTTLLPNVLKVPTTPPPPHPPATDVCCKELESAANGCLKRPQTDADRFRSMGLHLWKPHVDL